MKRHFAFSKKELPGLIIFAVLMAVWSFAGFRLFYAQCVSELSGTRTQCFNSDMWAYIPEMQGSESDITDFAYPVLFLLGRLFSLFMGPAAAMACACTLLNLLAMAVMGCAFRRVLMPVLTAVKKETASVIIALATGAVFACGMLMLPGEAHLPGLLYDYVGVGTPNPWHNATYLAARPFAIAAFFSFCRMLELYEKPGGRGEYIFFALMLLLTTLAKPSYTLLLSFSAAAVMLLRLFRAGFRNFGRTVLFALCFVPTFALMLWQYTVMFDPAGSTGNSIVLGLGDVWKLYVSSIPAAILWAAAFPLTVLICRPSRVKRDTCFRFAWIQYAVAVLMNYFLMESGPRMQDFNFFWGYLYALLFLFAVSVLALVKDFAAAGKTKRAALYVQTAVLALHMVCGVMYYISLMQGHNYF